MQTTNDQNQSGQNLNNQGPDPQTSGCNRQEPVRRCPGTGEDKPVSEFGNRKILNGPDSQPQSAQNNRSTDQATVFNGQEPTRSCPRCGKTRPLSEFGYRSMYKGLKG